MTHPEARLKAAQEMIERIKSEERASSLELMQPLMEMFDRGWEARGSEDITLLGGIIRARDREPVSILERMATEAGQDHARAVADLHDEGASDACDEARA